MKDLPSSLVKKLNNNDSGLVYFEAFCIMTSEEDAEPRVYDYFANFSRPIGFQGNIYEPVLMVFSESEVSTKMEIPQAEIKLPNVGNRIDDYLDRRVIIEDKEIRKQLLVYDEGNDPDVYMYDEEVMSVEVLRTNDVGAIIVCGFRVKFDDPVPRQTLETNEFPALRADVIRAGSL